MAKRANVYINEAIRESNRSTCRHKHGSILVVGNRIVSRGQNHYDARYGCISIHSEIQTTLKAVRGRKIKIKNGTMIVVRVNDAGELRDSMPCLNCLRYMQRFGVEKIIYSVQGGFYKCNIDHALANCVKLAIVTSEMWE